MLWEALLVTSLFKTYSSISTRSQLLGSLQGFAPPALVLVLQSDDLGCGRIAARRLQSMKPLLSWEGGGWSALC